IGQIPPQWLNSDSFTSLFNAYSRFGTKPALRTETPSASRRGVIRRADTATEYLTISGTARRDGSGGQFEPGLPPIASFSDAGSDTAGNHCLRFFGESDKLADFCFTIDFKDVVTNADIDESDFVVRAPWPQGTKRVALVRDGMELASLTLTSNAPVVGIDA